MKPLRLGTSLVALMLFGAAVADAHEIGTTRVSVTFERNESYEIAIVTDAVALVEKLDALSGQTPAPSENAFLTDASVLQAKLKSYDVAFRNRVAVSFDGTAVRPAIDYSVSGAPSLTSPPIATIRLNGIVPQGARGFVWNYSWTYATYSLSVRKGEDTLMTQWLEGGEQSSAISLSIRAQAPSRIALGLRYLTLGFTHIVPHGFDHMLFVLGIFLLTRRVRNILAQVSAFTIAHSITLALSVYGVVSLSPNIVEPLIAVSIAYVAIENIFLSELKPWRLALVFSFGLLHGMGFAGALKELGLPRSQFVLALTTFNVGVEAGQLAVIAVAFVLVGWYCGRRDWYRRLVVIPASVLIACTALYWTVERMSL